MKLIIVILVFCLVSCGGKNANTRTSKNDSLFVTSGSGQHGWVNTEEILICLDSGKVYTDSWSPNRRYSELGARVQTYIHVTGLYSGDSNTGNYLFIKTGEHQDLRIVLSVIVDSSIGLRVRDEKGQIVELFPTIPYNFKLDSVGRSLDSLAHYIEKLNPFGFGGSANLIYIKDDGGIEYDLRPTLIIPSWTKPVLYFDYNTRPIRLPRW